MLPNLKEINNAFALRLFGMSSFKYASNLYGLMKISHKEETKGFRLKSSIYLFEEITDYPSIFKLTKKN